MRIVSTMNEESSTKGSIFDKFAPVLLLLTVVLAFMVGLLWQKVVSLEKGGVTNTNNPANQPAAVGLQAGKLADDKASKVPPVTDKDHIRGSKDAEIIIIEYSDLECPFCQQFQPTLNQVFKDYQGKVAWVYRHFPLDFHPRAKPSANASECVADLAGNDAFWKFIDTVFTDQEKYLTDEGLAQAAVAAGVKKADFDSCYAANKFESVIDADYKGGVDAGITGTPGNFVINKKGEIWHIPGAFPVESVKSTIDEALKS